MSEDSTASLVDLLRETREYSRYFGELGVETVDPVAPSEGPSDMRKTRPKSQPSQPTVASARPVVVAASDAPQDSLFGDGAPPQTSPPITRESMEDIWRDIGDCTRCGLCEGRTQVVNTHGNHKARLMFVGEAPGADEDVQGIPFVGRAGQLLTKIIEAIELTRDDVYIANVIKCRPPENRNPEPDEVATCEPFLFRQIDVIRPKVIVALGKFAAQTLLAVETPISRLRGNWFEYRGVPLMPTFHPAYLLRNPSSKRDVWEDMKLVRELLRS
jgi:uracil-DNA glycosylase family 4